MNNSNEWYTESDVLMLFGYSTKQSVYKFRDSVKTLRLSNRYLYSRSDIDALLEDYYASKTEKILLKEKKKRIKNYNIDFDKWIPLALALEIVPFSRQRLYQLKKSGAIETKEFDGFYLFDKESLKKLQKQK